MWNPKITKIDWLKWLVWLYLIPVGIWVFLSPTDIRALVAFYLGAITLAVHHRGLLWISLRTPVWVMVLLGLGFGLEITVGVWLAAYLIRTFVLG